MRLAPVLAAGMSASLAASAAVPADPHQWLEEVTGARALAWVKARNAEAEKELAGSEAFRSLEADLKAVYDSRARIPYVGKAGDFYYNVWRDADHPRGLWRRTTLAEYRKAEPAWDVLLDLDALAKAEGENWVWAGAQLLKPGYTRALIALSRGGADATVTREFDLATRSFVKDGFQLPEAKGGLSWIDRDTVYVSTDFGPGSLTASGYPRIVKLWKRGTELAKAPVVYEGQATDLSISAYHDDTEGFERDFVERATSFYSSETFLRRPDGSLLKLDVPLDAKPSVYREWMTVELRSPWTVAGKTHPGGSLLAIPFEAFLAGKRDFTALFTPDAHSSLEGRSWTKSHLLLTTLEDVKHRVWVLTPGKEGWKKEPFRGASGLDSVGVGGVDPEHSDDVWMTVSGYLTPTTLFHGPVGGALEPLKSLPAFFDAKGLEVSQGFATSKDGTKVPYFMVARKGLKLDGTNPTLLYGYGGFEVSMLPGYSAGVGRAWTGKGGVYVVANIRGGGEYGPRWHQAALKDKRHRAYEDMAAVAQDLVRRRITSARHLGTEGGSNGGLLMGNMITLYPQLFRAVVCEVPLLDMQRYHKLLAGASWMAEYGDPDKPEEWAFLKTFSPYHNLKAGTRYPSVLFTTSTRDDRVHPGHARKMMAAMQALGADVRYYENIEGGHGGAANNAQRAHMDALAYSFLWKMLK